MIETVKLIPVPSDDFCSPLFISLPSHPIASIIINTMADDGHSRRLCRPHGATKTKKCNTSLPPRDQRACSVSPHPPPSAWGPQKQHSSAANLFGGIHRHRSPSAPSHSQSLSPSHDSPGSKVEIVDASSIPSIGKVYEYIAIIQKEVKNNFSVFSAMLNNSPPTSPPRISTHFPFQ